MKNVFVASAVAAALSLVAAPALAQDLEQRQTMDRFDRVNAAYQQAVEQGLQAQDSGRPQVDYLANRKNLDQAEFIADRYRDLRAQQAIVKTESNPEGINREYLKQRKTMDSLQNINRVTGNS